MDQTRIYKRLQVNNIWLRTLFELAAIILAIVVCGNLIVANYEESYADATRESAGEKSMQLAHSISGLADAGVLALEDDERLEYAAQYYSELLESCFFSGDMLYSGAIYRVTADGCKFFAGTGQYSETLTGQKLLVDGVPAAALSEYIDLASAGTESSASTDSVYLSFLPVNDADGTPCAVIVTAVEFRDSLAYQSSVKSRLIMISLVSGVLILAYYCISAARSESQKKKGKAVD